MRFNSTIVTIHVPTIGMVLLCTSLAGCRSGGEREAVHIEPATAPVFAEEPDYAQYPGGLSGFTGMNLQEVTHLELKPAMRARIGQRGLYKTALVRLPSGTLLTTPCSTEGSLFRFAVYRSADEGRTWEEIQTEGATLSGGQEPALTCLEDGTVLLLTEQVTGDGARLFRSTDEGITWTRLECEFSTSTRNMLEQADGSLLLFDATSRLQSTDGGQTWPERETFEVQGAPGFHFREAALVQLAEDHLLAAVRMYGDEYESLTGDLISELPECRGMPKQADCSDHMVLLESEDGGLHWSKPRSFLGYSDVHVYLSLLQDGRLLATYTSNHLPYGPFAVLSEDHGKTWDTDRPIHLAMSWTSYSGWATSVQFPDGDILTAYAITAYLEGPGGDEVVPGERDTAAEVVRWRLPGVAQNLAPIEPATEPVFAEEPDYTQYAAGLAGFAGINLQQVAHWERKSAMRARVGHRGYYKGALVRLPTGELLAGPHYDEKTKQRRENPEATTGPADQHSSDEGRVRTWMTMEAQVPNKIGAAIFRSRDEGRSWELVQTQGTELPGGGEGESRFAHLPDGTLLLSTSFRSRSVPSAPAETAHDHADDRAGILRSTDNGVTWSHVVCDRGYGGYGNNIILQPDGSLLVFGSMGTDFPGAESETPTSTAWRLRSTDGGQTWTEREEVANWDSQQPMFSETFVLPLSETHFLATTRVEGDFIVDDRRPPRGLPTPRGDETGGYQIIRESHDAGLNWSKPWRLTNYGEVHGHLLQLADGRVMCTYANYHLPFGICAVFSEDDGQTWDNNRPIQLANSCDFWTGWPTSLQMPDGTILTSYCIQAYKEKNEQGIVEHGCGSSTFEVVRWELPGLKASPGGLTQ